jgi:hypothetical protein
MAFRVSFLLARILVVTYVILTAAYCLLAYIPFTYHQVVVGALLPWLSAFATFHSYFYWPAFAAAGLTLPWHTRKTRLGSIAFMVVYGAIGILLSLNPLLLHLENNLRSLAWCIFSLAPLLWLAALDWTAMGRATLRRDASTLSRMPSDSVLCLVSLDAIGHRAHWMEGEDRYGRGSMGDGDLRKPALSSTRVDGRFSGFEFHPDSRCNRLFEFSAAIAVVCL